MKKNQLLAKVGTKLSRAKFGVQTHSPEILVIGGVVGVVVSAVLACNATTKLSAVMEKSRKDIGDIKDYMENHISEEYTIEDGKKDLVIVYAKTSVELVKMYSPAVALGALSIFSILASNNILRKRNMALAAAYAVVDKGFKEYRERVIDRFGSEVDRELKYNLKKEVFEEQITDEKGKTKTVKNKVEICDLSDMSEYARFFDDGNRGWEKDAEFNLMFLRAQQQVCNDRLRVNGFLFLNEVYELLDMPRSDAGQEVGWYFNEKNPTGDNFVDFGLTQTHRRTTKNFVDGYENVILLDFNVDGPIRNMVWPKKK